MADTWNRYLQLPEMTLQGGKRIPKTVLTVRAKLSKKEQKVLANLRELGNYAMLGKSNTGILPHCDDTYDIRAVIYLDCLLGSWDRTSELALILHRAFANPTVLLMRTASPLDGCAVSVATKRKSLAETGASVVENVDTTTTLDPVDGSTAAFWDLFAYERLPQTDLLDYVHGMQDAILFHNLHPRLGFTPKPGLIHRAEIRRELVRLKRVDTEIRGLDARRYDKDTSFGESAELRVLASGKKEEAQTIVDHIKELSHE
ncbi:DUF4391 domain-containing protein [Bifidobacterium catulorum]|uniref:DUF4391 domain-containing protein n=1 Tax=Bifidobacterium catulorum TaxID=1630173 RepID=A0A2U2MSL1_9BIFI|nr:DUF4391 domain-containing protein [Bifidobacterium catulorum]PWG59847.1 hypothetical protein DF200_05335 [Bifidobacterium catulorum]